MLTPYDEFPVHQAPVPFSQVPSTDYSWDDGYYVGAFSPDDQIFLATGMRINPNTDMVGGYACINFKGEHHTLRFNRCWRRLFDTKVGPFRYEFIEPLRQLRMVLEPNDSALSFDIVWTGVSPAFEEERHIAMNRGRPTTDQTRYSQPGKCEGTLTYKGQAFKVNQEQWSGARDHSWGLYAERPPTAPDAKWLPPKMVGGKKRAMRFWTCFRSDPYSGFFHWHETADGDQHGMSDVFGGPFGGRIYNGWGEPIELVSVEHKFEYEPGTRILKKAHTELRDQANQKWIVDFESAMPAWMPLTIGYTPGSWKDGGTFHTYHGSEELALEWDEFDLTRQPAKFTPYGGQVPDAYGLGFKDGMVHGVEYLARVRTTAPDGSVLTGACQIEHFINGPWSPYGFE